MICILVILCRLISLVVWDFRFVYERIEFMLYSVYVKNNVIFIIKVWIIYLIF